MIHIFLNIIKKNYFFTIFKKIIKRFEKNTSAEAKQWAILNTSQTVEEFCSSIDSLLYDKIKVDIKLIEEEALNKLSKLKVSLGGGGNYILLYFLILKFKPLNIVETGVAAGWSSLFILRALKKNGKGYLFSSDFPYFRLKNPEQYIGYLAQNEINKHSWFLDIRGDDLALQEIVNRLKNSEIDIFHYDSDKSYSGRSKSLNILSSKINSKTIIIFDDIQNNLHFRDYVYEHKKNFHVLEFQGKYVGIVGCELL
ncbi:class I SAM-dependent methyltransferase [Candidatus Pelagibacter bacterium nBUS_28]|jgi:predicted O-methyltransferase YrrM|uniref:class I SAM-dependent methyltransferase n=1 Tax=Candidatus Pelagibacter bacterium nBUS_28 TaxID=3374189 RepID=UPI003EBEECC3